MKPQNLIQRKLYKSNGLVCIPSSCTRRFRWKKDNRFFACSQVATVCFVVRNPLLVEVTLTASSKALRYFEMGPSPQSFGVLLLSPLLLNLYLLLYRS